MSKRTYNFHDGKHGAAMAVRVTSNARKNEIVEILRDGTMKVRLVTKSKDGEVNRFLLKFLAEKLEIPLTKLEIIAGVSGRDKLVSILDMDADTLDKKIAHHLP